MTPGATMKLEFPDAVAPVACVCTSSDYFVVYTSLWASTTGVLTNCTCAHEIERSAYLHSMEPLVLQFIVLQPFPFNPSVVRAMAAKFRTILTSADHAWTSGEMKEAQAVLGQGAWGLLFPMTGSLTALKRELQTPKHSECYSLEAAESLSSSESGAAGSATGAALSGTTSAAPQPPSWL